MSPQPPPPDPYLSPDGRYRWDGVAWKSAGPPPPMPPRNRTGTYFGVGCLALVVMAIWGGGSLASRTQPSSSAATSPTAAISPSMAPTDSTPTPVAPPQDLKWNGAGSESTAPFTLHGGTYSAAYATGGACFFGISLNSVDGSYFQGLLSGSGKGGTYLYNVPAGQFYWKIITGSPSACSWSLAASGP